MVGGAKNAGRGDSIMARAAEGKEFDPLSTQRSLSHDNGSQHKVMSSFGIANDGQLALRVLISVVGVFFLSEIWNVLSVFSLLTVVALVGLCFLILFSS